MLRIHLTSVPVDDQARALAFYTEVLGFQLEHDLPVGEHRWLTVVSPLAPEGPALLLEPAAHPATRQYQAALKQDGIPIAAFQVEDVHDTHRRLAARGVHFPQAPTQAGPVVVAVLDDTCGNLVQLVTPPETSA
ncbi:MAG: putative Glyoxalase protein [Frankiales bacterium]|nr:putative Glyoxalase protein [Frankiales bacterium]